MGENQRKKERKEEGRYRERGRKKVFISEFYCSDIREEFFDSNGAESWALMASNM